jgi:uncharacterized protein (TIGR00369 family)
VNIQTHQKIDQDLCGRPLNIETGTSKVEMLTTENMAVDGTGLVHGGFIFGLADHAAMIAVNHPNVVLGAAEVKFLKPVQAGETVIAEALIKDESGKKMVVRTTVSRNGDTVFEGHFTCFVLDRHVLK